jgi:hypothetical protein
MSSYTVYGNIGGKILLKIKGSEAKLDSEQANL